MDARLTWAVRNNANWCDLVCRSHRIPTRFRPDLWATAQPPPQFYPNAVTLQAHVTEAGVLAAISPHPGASVKDSFATLDLGRHGFDELFEARWITYDKSPTHNASLRWTAVETEAALAEWTDAAGLTDILGTELLRDPNVTFLAAHDEHGIIAGAAANLTGPVAGVSNMFATTTSTISDDALWAEIPAAVEAVFPNVVLVGYEHGPSLRAAIAAGFRDLGPLRVWLESSAA